MKQTRNVQPLTCLRPNVLLVVWILVCAWCSLWGWGLSAIGKLATPGYAVTLGIGIVLLGLAWPRLFPGWKLLVRPQRVWWRHRHLLPLLFSAVAGLGGLRIKSGGLVVNLLRLISILPSVPTKIAPPMGPRCSLNRTGTPSA